MAYPAAIIATHIQGDPEFGPTIKTAGRTSTSKQRVLIGWTHQQDTPDGMLIGKIWCWVSEHNKLFLYDKTFNRSKVAGEVRFCGVANFTMVRMFHPYWCPGGQVPQDMNREHKRECRHRYRQVVRRWRLLHNLPVDTDPMNPIQPGDPHGLNYVGPPPDSDDDDHNDESVSESTDEETSRRRETSSDSDSDGDDEDEDEDGDDGDDEDDDDDDDGEDDENGGDNQVDNQNSSAPPSMVQQAGLQCGGNDSHSSPVSNIFDDMFNDDFDEDDQNANDSVETVSANDDDEMEIKEEAQSPTSPTDSTDGAVDYEANKSDIEVKSEDEAETPGLFYPEEGFIDKEEQRVVFKLDQDDEDDVRITRATDIVPFSWIPMPELVHNTIVIDDD